MMVRGSTPCASSSVAAVCRRSWYRMLGRPAAQGRLERLVAARSCRIAIPIVVANTNPDFRPRAPVAGQPWNCARNAPERLPRVLDREHGGFPGRGHAMSSGLWLAALLMVGGCAATLDASRRDGAGSLAGCARRSASSLGVVEASDKGARVLAATAAGLAGYSDAVAGTAVGRRVSGSTSEMPRGIRNEVRGAGRGCLRGGRRRPVRGTRRSVPLARLASQ